MNSVSCPRLSPSGAAATRPPTNAAMNPLAPIASAAKKVATASATSAICSKAGATVPRAMARATSRPPRAPATAPTTTPPPMMTSPSWTRPCSGEPSTATAAARANITTGTHTPSLRPASTSSPSRTRSGTRRSVTTGAARAASVGASRAPSNSTSQMSSCPSSARPASTPRPIVIGRPTPSSRSGRALSSRRRRSPRVAAPANSTSASAISAARSTTSCWPASSSWGLMSAPPATPTARPPRANTIAGLITVPPRRLDSSVYASRTAANSPAPVMDDAP